MLVIIQSIKNHLSVDTQPSKQEKVDADIKLPKENICYKPGAQKKG